MALSNNSARGNSRILIHLPRGLTLLMSLEIICSLVPLTKRFVVIGTEAARCALDFGGPAVLGLEAR
jgi:hypothetical protein